MLYTVHCNTCVCVCVRDETITVYCTVYCIGQAGHGRGKDDSCGSTMAIYINYLSMLEAQKYLSVKGGGGDWRGGGGREN